MCIANLLKLQYPCLQGAKNTTTGSRAARRGAGRHQPSKGKERIVDMTHNTQIKTVVAVRFGARTSRAVVGRGMSEKLQPNRIVMLVFRHHGRSCICMSPHMRRCERHLPGQRGAKVLARRAPLLREEPPAHVFPGMTFRCPPPTRPKLAKPPRPLFLHHRFSEKKKTTTQQ